MTEGRFIGRQGANCYDISIEFQTPLKVPIVPKSNFEKIITMVLSLQCVIVIGNAVINLA